MFKTPCFIKKNTSELRKKLEELGYNQHPSYCDNGQYLYLNRGFYHTDVIGYTEEIERMIDCEANEELFLAIAALKDNSDYMQWFVCPKTHIKRKSGWFGQIIGIDGHYREIVGYEWHRHENNDNALTKKINEMIQMEVEDTEFLPHKATIEELIEHFKK